MLASILKWFTEQFTGDVIVDLTGVSSRHGVGQITVEGAAEPVPATLTLVGGGKRRPRLWRPWRRPRRPDVVVAVLPQMVDVDIPLRGVSSNHGVGQITVETPFDVTDDEMLAIMLLVA